MLNLNHDSWMHLYGVFNGLYLASVLYVIFFGVQALLNKQYRAVAYPFFLIALILACFGLYALFYQYSYKAITTHAIGNMLFTLGKFAAPIGLIIVTHVIVTNLIVRSFRINDLLTKKSFIVPLIQSFYVACFIGLWFIDNPVKANLLICVLFLPAILFALSLIHVELENTWFKKMLVSLLAFAFCSAVIFITLILPESTQISMENHMALHMFYGISVLVISFSIVRYGFEFTKLFYDIKHTDNNKLFSDLYTAINKKQFFMVYQPKLDLKTNRVCGVEALIRWEHPTKGTISPMEFIPMAEKTDMIDRICKYTVDASICFAKNMRDQGIHLPVAINFSTRNLTPDMVMFVASCLAKHDLPVDVITIEITESVFIEVTHQESQALNMLKEMNIPLSLDDYGTGFSSLHYINALALSELKIDKSFIRDMHTDESHRIIVASTLSMSHDLNLKVVAEGVEDATILDMLTDLGCDMVQGFGVFKPMHENQITDWVENNRELFS